MITDPIQIKLTIPVDYQGKRLDQTLAALLPEYSRERIKQWILLGNCQINGQTCKPKDKVAGGELVIIAAQAPAEIICQPEEIALDIIFEDEDVLVMNKPVGLVVHPGAGNPASTLVNALLFHDATLETLPRAGIVHRLDKDTSGLMVVAKSLIAHTSLVQQLESRSVKRSYEAIVVGAFTAGGTVDAPIARHSIDRTKMAVKSTGKTAITHYRVLQKFLGYTHLRLQLETGRTHQIRVHMAHMKHPIVGDKVYGGRLKMPKGIEEELKTTIRQFPRQALHAIELAFVHPRSKALMKFEVPLPSDMQQLLVCLRKYAI